MTAITVSATINQTSTPTGPSEIKICTTGAGGPPQTLDLGTPGDGKTWYFVKGHSAKSGTAIVATISGTTLTIPKLTASAVVIGNTAEAIVLQLVRA